jgi:hypothetical protein
VSCNINRHLSEIQLAAIVLAVSYKITLQIILPQITEYCIVILPSYQPRCFYFGENLRICTAEVFVSIALLSYNKYPIGMISDVASHFCITALN